MKRGSLMFFLLSFVCLLAACGGGGGSAAAPVVAKGVFVDGPVAGLGFQSGSKSGFTGSKGEFDYEQGKSVRFNIGDIVIGETTGEPVVTLLHLVPGADAANAKVINISRFLLSVGTFDQATTTITIPDSVNSAAKGKTIDFSTVSEADLLNMVRVLKNDPNAVLVSNEVTTNELTTNLLKIYGGTYQGTFTGPAASSKWELTIDPNTGVVTGRGIDGSKETISGTITNGILFNGQAELGCTLTGSINVVTGELRGTWQYVTDLARNGQFTGKKI